MKKFNSEDIALQGSNLIEASAGTGKTYSIAILVLRLLLEERMPVQELLLVTFTEAAAAELKERTARFIRIALKEVEVKMEASSTDKTIWRIVNKSIASSSVEDVKMILNTALLDIDLASIQTIHSFCQGTLTEFAFETNQMFGSKLLQNTAEVIYRFLNEYWRSKITVLDVAIQNLFPNDFRSVLYNSTSLILSNHAFSDRIGSVSDFNKIKQIDQDIYDYYNGKNEEFVSRIESIQLKGLGTSTREKALEIISNATDFHQVSHETRFKIPEVFAVEVEFSRGRELEKSNLKKGILNGIISEASIVIAKQVKDFLVANNLLTFDALIENLHLVKDEEKLKKVLRAKYKAIFIDEFQDTDKLQYEIFEAVFQENPTSVLFYIGDPKQSIYAFRKADLNTYFTARNQVNNTWTMNINFRSTDSYVISMNAFFEETTDFNTFHYDTKEITYHKVEASESKIGKIGICNNGSEIYTPLQIRTNYSNKSSIQDDVTNLVLNLLDGKHTIDHRLIQPSDFGILVRSNADGRAIKKLLELKGVPAVVVDETSVFKSNEANDLNFILSAILLPNKSNIDKALLTQLLGYKSAELKNIDPDKILVLFRNYYKIWHSSGVYPMLRQFLTDFGIETRWTANIEIGHRVLSNIFQITELLQKTSVSRNFTPAKLKAFLNSAIYSSNEQDDAFAQRIERDEDAVKIATIHKSKGLQYNIVLLPNLDFVAKERGYFSNLKDDSKSYLFTTNPISTPSHSDLFIEQEEQENRRLIYVALTRACFNCFVFINEYHKISSIKNFTKKLIDQTFDMDCLETINGKENIIPDGIYSAIVNSNALLPLAFPSSKPNDHNWNKMSYSFLAAKHKSHATEDSSSYEKGYDRFIFKELEKGMHVGNMLHNIFEFLDFTDSTEWEKVIEISLQQFTASKKEEYLPWMRDLIANVLNADIQIGEDCFQLNSIENSSKINELEFDFPIEESFDIQTLQSFLMEDDHRIIQTGYGEVKGMLTGFIDLFFEHKGKYYILDWKSNFLGDTLHHYNKSALMEGMNQSNYHLQYMIYSLAIKKYLESKFGTAFNFNKHFGGVIYLFLRGVRQGSDTGIYATKLSLEEVEAMETIFQPQKKEIV
jgi:exodeoxyribonuclease V beta subunit